jgi:cephalosporin-C deacetylase-like acetyl esterase
LQFLKSRPEWDGKTLIVWGASQGGGQTLVAGGMDSDITLLLAGVPAMCDQTASVINRQPGWPRLLENIRLTEDKQNWDKAVQAVRYFDAANFATRIKAPIIVTAGFRDVTCAPTSVYAAYNAIPGENKQIYQGVDMEHSQNKIVWNLFREAAFKHAMHAIEQ